MSVYNFLKRKQLISSTSTCTDASLIEKLHHLNKNDEDFEVLEAVFSSDEEVNEEDRDTW